MVDKNNGLKTNYGSDSVHPNKKGYKIMSVLAEKAIFKISNIWLRPAFACSKNTVSSN